jgi:uncharacterized protein YcfL
MLRKLFIVFALLLTSACQSDYKLSSVKVTPVQELPTSSPVEVIKETPTKSVEPSPTPSVVTSSQKDIKAASEFLYRDTNGVHFKDYASYTSIYTSGDGLAEGTSYDVLPNGNITEGISGEYQGNYRTGLYFNTIGFLTQMLITGQVSNLADLDVSRDQTYNDIFIGSSKFHLDLLNDDISLNGNSVGLISDICKDHLCYDSTMELFGLFGAEELSFGAGDNTLDISVGTNRNSDLSYLIFNTAYHKDSKNGTHFSSATARVTSVVNNTVYFSLQDGLPDSNKVETSFDQKKSVGTGTLVLSENKKELTLSWSIDPLPSTDQLGYGAHFSVVYYRILNQGSVN